MRSGLLFAALLLTPLVALGGCVSCVDGPPVSARDVGPGTASEGGSGGFALRIRVTSEPGGPAIEGAGVVLYWARDAANEWGGNVSVEVDGGGPNGGSVVVSAPGFVTSTPEAQTTLRLRTDANGEALARVPTNRIVGLVAAAEGWTEEWLPAVATGNGGDAIEVPLFRARKQAELADTWGPGAVSTGTVTRNNYAWKPSEVPFGDDDATRRGYVQRLSEVRIFLNWTNGAGGAGDLAIGIGPTRDEPGFFEDSNDQIAPGAQREEVFLDAVRLAQVNVLRSPTAFVGPATDSGFIGPFGMPFTLALDARFDTAVAALAACANEAQDDGSGLPGASVPLGWLAPLAGLAGAGLLSRRPR